MTTPKKTASEISAAIITQLETSLNTTIPLLPKSFCRVLAKALGGVFVLLYQFAGFILLQLFVKTASNKPMTIGGVSITPLALWGELVDTFQLLGQRAEFDVEVDVITQSGTIYSGTRLVNPSTEMVYVSVGDVPLSASTVTLSLRATEIGNLGNVDVGTTISFVSPPSTVEKDTEVTSITTVGSDPETTEDFRERVIERFAARPQGGAYADYRDWAEEVEGVKNAYPYSGWGDDAIPDSTSGQVFVYIESDSDPDGVPTPLTNGRPPGGALLTSVFNYIENDDAGLANRRNINAFVRIFPIERTAFNVEINGLAVDAVDETRQAIEDGLTDYFLEREPYYTGYSVPPNNGIIYKSAVITTAAIIAGANGGAIITATVTVGGTPVGDGGYVLEEGEKAKLGVLTWT